MTVANVFPRILLGALLLQVAPLRAQSPGPPPAPANSPCDYECLTGLMDRYLAALVRHEPSAVPLARDVVFTEQAMRIPIGDGLWLSTTEGPTTFKIVAADPWAGQVGVFAVIRQWDKPVILAARLRVVSNTITEIEHVIAPEIRPAGAPNLVSPRPALLADVPARERTPRAEMLAAGNHYFDAIEQNRGSVAPFAADCVRHENGMQTTSNTRPLPRGPLDSVTGGNADAMAKLAALGCAAGLDTHLLSYISMIRPRHLLIIDERKGLVYGFPRFVHRGKVRSIKIVGVPGVDTIPMNFGPIDLQAGEIFKIRKGQIHEVEAMGFLNAYLTPTGWEWQYGTDE